MTHLRKRGHYTTDDISNINPKGYDIIIKLESILFRAWKILDDINQTLYHETTDTILKNKPIFDTQKKNLILLTAYKEKVIKNGLVEQKNIEIFEFNKLFFNNSTNFNEWNRIALELNSICNEIYNLLKLHLDHHAIIIKLNKKDMVKEKVIIKPKKTRKKRCIMLFFLMLVFVFFWYNFIFGKMIYSDDLFGT